MQEEIERDHIEEEEPQEEEACLECGAMMKYTLMQDEPGLPTYVDAECPRCGYTESSR